MADRKDLDKDGDQDIKVKGRLDRRGKRTIKALEDRCAAEPGFMDKLEGMCARLGTDVEWVVNVMMMESNLEPAKKNPKSSASGLIQFLAKTARGLGTTTSALRSMSATKQLDYVEKYLRPFAGKLDSQAAVYAAVGAGKVGNSDQSVMFRAGARGYNQNKIWDVNRDGKVTQGEMGRVASRFGAGEQFDIDDDASERDGGAIEASAIGAMSAGAEEESGAREEQRRPARQATPVQPGRIIGASVGVRGRNNEADVEAVQTTLAAHGVSPGTIDRQIGPDTIGAIRRFQRGFMRNPDGLVEPGQQTEQHLMSANPPRAREGGGRGAVDDDDDRERETEESETDDAPSRNASAQMARLESVADNVAGRRPGGMCYAAVKRHINNAGGYGNIRNIYSDRRFQPQGEARNFAEVVNRNPARFGLEKLSISNPYDAPVGSIIVVAAGSPGTRHRTAGDISVKGPGNAFYNDGSMGYQGRNAWPPRRGGVLGVYRPK